MRARSLASGASNFRPAIAALASHAQDFGLIVHSPKQTIWPENDDQTRAFWAFLVPPGDIECAARFRKRQRLAAPIDGSGRFAHTTSDTE
ncbi:hypothetical protein SSBR45G_25760 [Bradyrhizobium sp. SSBR45G]|nr:hypothetical protein SSBR45G_25760 [Bradyrhizobium sp. SSBR45G]GLH84905.1 hypothetical protein SSBR45R_23650 [Bradyrhizobium sp. SSBR45R]